MALYLDKRERQVLSMSLGLGRSRSMTHGEIAYDLEIPPQRVRTIRDNALERVYREANWQGINSEREVRSWLIEHLHRPQEKGLRHAERDITAELDSPPFNAVTVDTYLNQHEAAVVWDLIAHVEQFIMENLVGADRPIYGKRKLRQAMSEAAMPITDKTAEAIFKDLIRKNKNVVASSWGFQMKPQS